MADADLCYVSGTEALDAFAARRLSPVELMQAVIARAEAVEPAINALTFRHFDEAMDLARASESRWAKGAPAGPLDGLPMAVKDESAIAGKPTSGGSLITRDAIADFTSPVNERLIGAGAIVHARTATPEFSCAGYTWSRRWGVTRNPWNTAFSPGGSSGGSGAALAVGATTLATGSDIGGSIRIPASFCGVVGFKPPYGRNPEEPPFNLDFYCHEGPMARTVADTILMQNIMCGPHPHDIATIRPKLELPMCYPAIKGWRVALSVDLGCFNVDADVERNTRAAAEVFAALGAEVVEVDLDWTMEMMGEGLAYLRHIFGGYVSAVLDEHADEMTTYARSFAESALDSTPQQFLSTLETAGRMYDVLGPLLQEFNVLICPTAAIAAVPAEHDQSRDSLSINGAPVDPFLGWAMTVAFNMLSRCPVLALPSGFAGNGVPTGIQIVGRTYSDADVFQAGMAYEAALGGWLGAGARRPAL